MPAGLHLADLACQLKLLLVDRACQLACPYKTLHVNTDELCNCVNANRLCYRTQESRYIAGELVSYRWTDRFQS